MPSRGRPPAFGKPANLVALTLPEGVIKDLASVDPDMGWAIVKLLGRTSDRPRTPSPDPPDAELLPIGPRQFLIVVRHDVFADLPNVSLVPLGHGRAFLAFPPGRTIDALELAILDRLEDQDLPADFETSYRSFRAVLKSWRLDATLTFHERSIVVVEQHAVADRRRLRR